jgi:hypothetical protein
MEERMHCAFIAKEAVARIKRLHNSTGCTKVLLFEKLH